MFANESTFTEHVEQALQRLGYTTQREVRVRTGHRLDILATKDDVKAGIEVKFERRGILDDLTKSHTLLPLPEVDEMYVCGPRVFMNEDARALADRLGIGLLAVRDNGDLEWVAPCSRLQPAELRFSGVYTSLVEPGEDVTYNATIVNDGQKAAIDVEVRMVVAAPFVARHRSKARARRSMVNGQDMWTTTLACNMKRSVKPGKYPLLISLTAENLPRTDRKVEYEVRDAR